MRILFLARQSLPFSPRLRIEDQRLGGSETALVWVARGLARLGHDVVVVTHCGMDAGKYDGVRYFDLSQDRSRWQREIRAGPPDVLVLFRRMLDVTTDIVAKVRVFWALDHQGVYLSDPPSLRRGAGILWRRVTGPLFHQRVDRVFVLSNFMAEVFRWLFRTPQNKLVVMPIGIDGSLFPDQSGSRVPLKFVHTSVPERGLAQLLREIFPAIRRTHRDAELHVFSYQPLDRYRQNAGKGVRFHGWVRKEDLSRALGESWLMLYPANFEEMGAISVLESMAAGTPAVTSARGVLSELAGGGSRGIAVDGLPGTSEFARRYIEATLELLGDPPRIARMREAAREYALANHGWDSVVRRWDEVLCNLVGQG